jgi:hypothetical protein
MRKLHKRKIAMKLKIKKTDIFLNLLFFKKSPIIWAFFLYFLESNFYQAL